MTRIPMPVLKEDGRTFEVGWRRIMVWAAAYYPALPASLNAAATTAEIDAAEESCHVEFPADLRALYGLANGESDNFGLFFGLMLLPLARLVKEWSNWREVGDAYPELNVNDAELHSSTPAGAIQVHYTNPGWIPFAFDHGGNHLGVDLAPGPQGKRGQIINFGSDEDAKFVIAPSLASFVNWCADNLEIGNFRIEPNKENGFFEFALADPPNAHFLDAVKAMGNERR